ncbi:MAG: bacterioferritin-associated ferredoxin, partial [Burkholderiales bacterium]|nr:bacterioferritin-associated ferredoxin [Burkholderiales bacterium]
AMYVCLCHGVTDGQIRRAVDAGCCSMRKLSQELKVATNCGRCAVHAKQVLDDTRAERAPSGMRFALV